MFLFFPTICFALFLKTVICDEENVPGNRTDFDRCKVTHMGIGYMGHIANTEGNIRCQSWSTKNPVHKVHESYTDKKFPDFSKEKAHNYCRNPSRTFKGPWCYTMDPHLSDDSCGIPLCSLSVCRLTGPGMEYAGTHRKAVSDAKCLKWDKDRKKVRLNNNITRVDKFDKYRFPDETVGDAMKNCRNPDGDIGGPWCFIEVENSPEVMKSYCDIPFCDDQDCMLFTRNVNEYGHYIRFPKELRNFTFGIKLWDPDSYLDAKAKLVLSVLPLPVTGKEMEDLGTGIEFELSNTKSALTYGNKDKPEYETSHGIIISTEYTFFSLSWDRGFITLTKFDQIKPMLLQEIKTKKNLMGKSKDEFLFYSATGDNIMWSFPFCDDDGECDVHTTTSASNSMFWPLEETDIGHELQFYVRAFHSANILLVASPALDYPNVKISLGAEDGYTRITCVEYKGGPTTTLQETKFPNLLSYWKFTELGLTLFADSLQLHWDKDVGIFSIMDVKHPLIKAMRWFSPSSENSLARWTFNCEPPKFAYPNKAFLPECTVNKMESNYIGTQQVSHSGRVCLPWAGKTFIPKTIRDIKSLNELLIMKNFCRDVEGLKEGTYCYTLSPERKVEKEHCTIRKCKSAECRIAGTGNDYIGKLPRTRSNRTCQYWVTDTPTNKSSNGTDLHESSKRESKNQRQAANGTQLIVPTEVDNVEPQMNDITAEELAADIEKTMEFLHNPGFIMTNIVDNVKGYVSETDEELRNVSRVKVHDVDAKYLNGTLFADMSARRAENFCRNPSRSLNGAWCYTTDINVPTDACNVPDCDKSEECIIMLNGNGNGRRVFVLPQWRESGVHGGFRFSLKQWNPDATEGIKFEITGKEHGSLTLALGAVGNQKVLLHKEGKLVKEKTLPYLIPSGKWVSLWLQLGQGEVKLGYEGVTDTLFEWKSDEIKSEFQPMFMNFMSVGGHPMGLFSTCGECHAENTTTEVFSKVMPINIWTRNEQITFENLTLYLRGAREFHMRLMHIPGMNDFYTFSVYEELSQVTLKRTTNGSEELLARAHTTNKTFTSNSWTLYNFTFEQFRFVVYINETKVMNYNAASTMLFYYFSLAAGAKSWITWQANCDPLDIDGPPKDGGWSDWASWYCTVSCGGGEGYRTRTCSNPRPNIYGQLCHGSTTSTGKCNEFDCGDLSPETFDTVRKHLQQSHYTLTVEEGKSVTVFNDNDLLNIITVESPDAYYEWSLNGQFIKPVLGRVDFQGDDIVIRNTEPRDSGVYVAMLYRINDQRLIFRVVTLAVLPKTFTIVTRVSLGLTLDCKSLSLGYVFSDLSQKWQLNGKTFIDYGTITIAAVSIDTIERANKSMNGLWMCIVEQRDLNLKWTTNIERIKVKRAHNVFTHLKEDPVTRPIFGRIKSDAAIVVFIIFMVFCILSMVAMALYAYLKWGVLGPRKAKRRRNRRFKK